jgi:hypothetical protein
MAADHGAIHYGRDTIWGEENEVIRWKLQGEGLTTYEPTWEGDVHLTGGVGPTLVDLVFHISIIAMGRTRALTIHAIDPVTLAVNPATPLSSAAGAIPAEHCPVAPGVHKVGYGYAGATHKVMAWDLLSTGLVRLWNTAEGEWPLASGRTHCYVLAWANGEVVPAGQVTITYLVD